MRLVLALSVLAASSLVAQEPAPRLEIYADTAGVAAVGDSVYLTWVFAKATPNGLPSSGILVGFACKEQRVRRYAHVVYHLTDDSTGVTGTIVADSTEWVPVTIPRLFQLVCQIGPTHGSWEKSFGEHVMPPAAKPRPTYKVS